MVTRKVAFITILLSSFCTCNALADYWTDRENFIQKERSQALGSKIKLTAKEKKANSILMAAKYEEFDIGLKNPGTFPASRHFFRAKEDIETSKVFKFIRKLPKGASLHSHDFAIGSFDILYDMTLRDDLYACTVDGRLQLQFFHEKRLNSDCNWQLLKDLRAKDTQYDVWLKKQLSLVVENPEVVYTDTNKVWQEFMARFITVTPLLSYRPVFKEYFYRALKELYDDNVMYMEFRGTLPTVYDLDGQKYGPVDVLRFYNETTEEFRTKHPDFLGTKFIYAPLRHVNNNTMLDYIETLMLLKSVFGDFMAGFDLVGQEDLGEPLESFIGELQAAKRDGANLYFHAGETNWYGATDLNLVDAVLLGTKRIGHGFGLVKHPKVLEVVKQHGIGIELNPISNQVLRLVDDFRNHPGSYLLANDYPVVICNDDPSFWGAKALSYDWYEAFMGMTSREADLSVLKQLALNSLQYSALEGTDLSEALNAWRVKWDQFIDSVVKSNRRVDDSSENLVTKTK